MPATLPDVTRASLEARDRLLQATTKYHCARLSKYAQLSDNSVANMVQDLRALYSISMDMGEFRKTFLLPYMAIMLVGTRFFAKTKGFKDSVSRCPSLDRTGLWA